jgi:RNA recognition motif-containing protein
MEGPRRWQPTGTISETSKHIYNQLEMDDIEPEEEEDEHKWREMEEALEEKDRKLARINDPKRLVKVEQLSDDVTAEDLLELFKGKSEKLKVHIAIAADGKRRGYAFVSFANSREAIRATKGQMDRTLLGGKKIICRWMGGKKARTRGLGVGGKRIFKGEGIGPWVELKSGEGGETEISVPDVAEKEEK